ncbi:MAG: hypothetical protein ACPGXX_16685, partial [Planctomycetaceae bacterium]
GLGIDCRVLSLSSLESVHCISADTFRRSATCGDHSGQTAGLQRRNSSAMWALSVSASVTFALSRREH